MNNELEEIKEIEILKINHDEALDKILKKYSLEEGWNVEVISTKSIDARTEKITIRVKNSKIKEKEHNL